LIVGLALAFCFFRVAAVAFHIITFLFWVAVGLVVVGVIYSALRLRAPNLLKRSRR
jgi:hypothetical protein